MRGTAPCSRRRPNSSRATKRKACAPPSSSPSPTPTKGRFRRRRCGGAWSSLQRRVGPRCCSRTSLSTCGRRSSCPAQPLSSASIPQSDSSCPSTTTTHRRRWRRRCSALVSLGVPSSSLGGSFPASTARRTASSPSRTCRSLQDSSTCSVAFPASATTYPPHNLEPKRPRRNRCFTSLATLDHKNSFRKQHVSSHVRRKRGRAQGCAAPQLFFCVVPLGFRRRPEGGLRARPRRGAAGDQP
mmetsp:Transcript_9678/g.31686  ORF Transcript_9678/g.31686 Transcript_9678/m.31686 type:complete len:242 (-) Transcript_9678:281-1006(-)